VRKGGERDKREEKTKKEHEKRFWSSGRKEKRELSM
jgi:hypothetical protein